MVFKLFLMFLFVMFQTANKERKRQRLELNFCKNFFLKKIQKLNAVLNNNRFCYGFQTFWRFFKNRSNPLNIDNSRLKDVSGLQNQRDYDNQQD